VKVPNVMWFLKSPAGLLCLTTASAALFLCRAHHEVMTYVCGNDPMLYMRAARVLLHPELYGREALIDALTFVAPGFPLLLAACMAVFGDLSAYWLNLVLLIVTAPVMWLLFFRIMRSPQAASISVLGWLMIVMSGHHLNVPYMMYPFRETSRLLCVLLCYLVLFHGARSARRWPLVGGGALLVLACGIREPSVLILPGALLGLGLLKQGTAERLRACGWMLLPFGVSALVGLVVAMSMGIVGSAQMSAASYIFNHDVARERLLQMLPWFPVQAGWIGLGLIALGIARSARRAPVMLAWFLLPALLFFVFYAYMQMHTRYFLTSMVFLAPFAGYGVDGLITFTLSRLPGGVTRARAQLGSVIICFAIAGVSLANVTRHLNPWGPEVSRAEVRAWQDRVCALTAGPDGRVRIALEQRCRYLEDVLLGYTDAELLNPKAIDQWGENGGENWAPAHYFKPLDRGALYATPQWLEHLQVFAHRSIASRHNLLPVAPEDDATNIALGDGHFEQMEIRPWTIGPHAFAFAVPGAGDALLWLDLGVAKDAPPATVTLFAQDGSVALEHDIAGSGFSLVHIPAGRFSSGTVRGRLAGKGPLPINPVVDCRAFGDALFLDMGPERPLAANRLFPSLKPRSVSLFPLRLTYIHDKEFLAPDIYADPSVRLYARFHCNAAQRQPFAVVCTRDNAAPLLRDIHPGVGTWNVPLPAEGTLRMRLMQAAWPGDDTPLTLNGVEIWAEKSNRSE
jgi:hypothetical protein